MSTNKIAEAITELIKNGDRETLGNMLILITEILKTNPQKKGKTQTISESSVKRTEGVQTKQTTSLFAPPTARLPSKEQQMSSKIIDESYEPAIDPRRELEEARKNSSLSNLIRNNEEAEEDVLSRSMRILG